LSYLLILIKHRQISASQLLPPSQLDLLDQLQYADLNISINTRYNSTASTFTKCLLMGLYKSVFICRVFKYYYLPRIRANNQSIFICLNYKWLTPLILNDTTLRIIQKSYYEAINCNLWLR